MNQASELPSAGSPRIDESTSPPRGLLRSPAAAWLVALLVALAVSAVGLASDLSLGDENYHFRKAAQFAEHRARLTHDPDYGPTVPPGIRYSDGPLWHGLLAVVFQMTGRSVWAAQLYQALWVALLVGLAWMAGRELGGHRTGWWCLITAATLPVTLFFGVVLYVETAMMALIMLTAVLLFRRQLFLAGLAFGASFLVKPTMVLAFPAFVTACLMADRGSPWRRLLGLALAGLGAAVMIGPDLLWRQVNFGTVGVVYLSRTGGDPNVPQAIRGMLLEKGPETFYWTSSVLDPRDLAMYLGGLVALGTLVSLLTVRRHGRPAWVLWAVLAALLVPHAAVMAVNHIPDIRYAMPVFPALVLLAALAWTRLLEGHRGWTAVVVILAVLQAAAVGLKAVETRRVEPQMKTALEQLGRLQVRRPPGYVIAAESLVTTYSGRPNLWAAINPGPFFFTWSPEKQWTIMDYYGVEFIAVTESRVYDDTAARHTGGFPRSYVQALPAMPYVDGLPVIQGGGLTVYRIRPKPDTAPPASP